VKAQSALAFNTALSSFKRMLAPFSPINLSDTWCVGASAVIKKSGFLRALTTAAMRFVNVSMSLFAL
jgi:hypothetical protein